MGNKKNEQGYALLIVLFLVVFIMIVTAVFMRGSISNAKQERKVDQNHLSVVAAEMGVDYYSTLFTNKFLEERDEIWIKNNSLFQADKAKILTNKELSEQERIDKINLASIEYRQYIVDELRLVFERTLLKALDEIEVLNKRNGTFSLSSLSEDMISNVGEDKDGNIEIKGKITGKYADKDSELYLEFIFPIPSLLLSDVGSNPDAPPEENTDYTDDLYNFHIENKKNVLINMNGDLTKGNIQRNENVLILTKGQFNTGHIGSNTTQLKINTKNDFKAGNIQNNENVLILTKGQFNAGHIEDNKEKLSMRVTNDFSTRDIYNNYGNISRNEDTSFLTNGIFNVGVIQKNKKQIIINTTGNFNSKNIDDNENMTVLTNGKMVVGTIQRNLEQLKISATENFESGNIDANKNMSILTNSIFNVGAIQKNEGFVKINATKGFISKNIDENQNTSILTNVDFEAGSIQKNKDSMKISVTGNFTSGLIEGNGNINILVNKDFNAKNIQKNTEGMKISVTGNFTSDLIENNGNLNILTNKDFSAKKINIKNKSQICVRGNFEVKEDSIIDNTSYLYLIKGKNFVGKIADLSRVKYLTEGEWQSQCGIIESVQAVGKVEIVETIENEGQGGVGNLAPWENPIVKVEY